MKRALALLEQTKNTMPHLPRPVSGKDSDSGSEHDNLNKLLEQGTSGSSLQYQKSGKRNPSAQGRTRILGQNSNAHNSNTTEIKNNNNMVTEMSSRKSTAVSSSTRVGSGGGILTNNGQSARNGNKRTSFAGTGSFNAADIIEKEKQQQQPLYELSLKSTATSKKPHKLKPLNSTNAKITNDNKANSILEIENAYQKEIMKDIEQDLTDYLDTNQLFSQMQSAFGNTTTTPTTLIKSSEQKKKINRSLGTQNVNTTISNQSALDPIIEEDSKQVGSLVLYQPNANAQEQRAKKNQALKNKVKQLTGGGSIDTPAITAGGISNFQSNETDTFITGTKVANKDYDGELAIPEMDDKMLKEYESHMQQRKKKHYKYEEDELLDDLDQHERDMNEMLKYLSEVEDLIKGQDLKSIQQMMDVTKETMDQHFKACDKFKGQIQDIDNQAEAAIKILNFYDSDGKNIDGSNKMKSGGQYQLDRVIEDVDEGAEYIDKKSKPSQEQSKTTIVSKLNNMNRSIRDFTNDLESRLDRAYKSGATKKFGYDGLTTGSQLTAFEDGKKEERALNKISSQAQQFIEQNSASALLKSSTPSSISSAYARKNSNTKALPSSQGSSQQIEVGGAQKRKSSVKNMRPKINNKSTTLNNDLNLY